MRHPNSKYGIDDVKRDRTAIDRGLNERFKIYARNAEKYDRPAANIEARNQAQQALEQSAKRSRESASTRNSKPEVSSAGQEVPQDVAAVLAALERRARGES